MKTIARRDFLKTTAMGALAAVAFPYIIRSSALGADDIPAPSNRIVMGFIGVGKLGRESHLEAFRFHKDVHVVAVCDVETGRLERSKQIVEKHYAQKFGEGVYKGCDMHRDFRELIARPDIDAVCIATPDHWHAILAIEAAKAGKDIYCEKPMTRFIADGRAVVNAVRRYGRVFQTGTQYRSIPRIRQVCEFVRAGGLGRIKSVFTIWGQYPVPTVGASYVPLDPVLPAEPVPEGLDWDLWVGPAPWRPYNQLYHRNPPPGVVPWAFCEAFGVAAVTGYHSHAADVIQYALGMETSGPVEIIHPASGEFPTLTCRYANGTLLHHVDHWGLVKDVYKAVPAKARLEGSFGGVFVGERGWLTSMSGHGSGPIEGGPEGLFKEMKLTLLAESLANNHHANWFECLRSRARPSSHEEIGHRSASLGHLVIIAYRLGRSLKWDPVKEEFVGDDAANRLRSRAPREPWRM